MLMKNENVYTFIHSFIMDNLIVEFYKEKLSKYRKMLHL